MTVTVDFANGGALNPDTGSGDGGGSLTITGTLTNSFSSKSGAAQVGNGFANSGDKQLDLGRAGQPERRQLRSDGLGAHSARVTVNGIVTSSGSLNIGVFANFIVSGAYGVSRIATLGNAGVVDAGGVDLS